MPDEVKSGERIKIKDKPLNAKQQMFISEMVRTNDQRIAAINSGYRESNASSTASTLMKDPRISKAIQTKRDSIHRELTLKSRPMFLAEVEAIKAMCLEKGRVGELIKLLSLEASVLGIDKRDVSVQTTNVFNTIESAKRFLNIDTATDMPIAEAVCPVESTNTHTEDIVSTLSGDVIDITPKTGVGE